MEKNQIFMICGTEYKNMTREILEESGLADLIGDRKKRIGSNRILFPPPIPPTGLPPTGRSWRES